MKKRKVLHRKRVRFNGEPGHVVLNVREGLPSLRRKSVRRVILDAMVAMQARFDCRVIDFSILSNHIHLIVEPRNERELARGMKSFKVRVARALNKLWNRKGTFWGERYYFEIVRRVHQLKRLIRYVLQNARKHGLPIPPGPDRYSSGLWFERWEGHRGQTFTNELCPVGIPRDMALARARDHMLAFDDLPGRRPRPHPARGAQALPWA